MAMKRVIKQTIDNRKLAELNRKLLGKVNKDRPQEARAVAEYTEENSDIQRQRVQPNELTVQWKHNKQKIGIVRSKFCSFINMCFRT